MVIDELALQTDLEDIDRYGHKSSYLRDHNLLYTSATNVT